MRVPRITSTWVAVLAALIAALGILGIGVGQLVEASVSAEDRAIDTCRARLAAVVTDSQTDYLLAIGALVEAISADADLDPAIASLAETGDALSDDRDLRVGFEDEPDPNYCEAQA